MTVRQKDRQMHMTESSLGIVNTTKAIFASFDLDIVQKKDRVGNFN